jgi:hypothetical protein
MERPVIEQTGRMQHLRARGYPTTLAEQPLAALPHSLAALRGTRDVIQHILDEAEGRANNRYWRTSTEK